MSGFETFCNQCASQSATNRHPSIGRVNRLSVGRNNIRHCRGRTSDYQDKEPCDGKSFCDFQNTLWHAEILNSIFALGDFILTPRYLGQQRVEPAPYDLGYQNQNLIHQFSSHSFNDGHTSRVASKPAELQVEWTV